ncbi:7-cyano-7-deazaguanine synthase QueC [Methylophilaceae bacterium]|nr:7-cyano-7-deazaguanine synthase QueC [Methylophilaceae bacterium]
MSRKAIILLSGGLDSSTVLAIAKAKGFECYALTINYNQRHNAELKAARDIAKFFKVQDFKIVNIDLSWLKNSALTNKDINIPENPSIGIPVTYVPARNTIMMTLALAWAETINSQNIFIGVNAVDYSGYPDCRPEYIESFQNMANLATKAGVEGNSIKIHTPLIEMTKAEIIHEGIKNNVDYKMTVSCYQANKNGFACGKCDSCRLRKEGFRTAQIEDPTNYQDLDSQLD